jgi:hypothetical protein
MSLFHAAAAQQGIIQVRPPVSGIPYKVMKSLAAVMVPAHGFIAGTSGLSHGSSFKNFRRQAWEFFKNLARSCAIAAAIAAGLLIYQSFVAKWKEKGLPTIPISALIAADQIGPRQGTIPLAGSGSAYSPNTRSTTQGQTQSRQTSLLDLDEYEG